MDLQDLLQDAIDKGEGGLYQIPKPKPDKLPEMWTMHPLVYRALLEIKQNRK